MAPGPLLQYEDDIESRTRWWDSYPSTGFNQRTQAVGTFANYLDEVFGRPKRAARSASATNLTFIREAEVSEKPVKRSPSFSSLSPSHGLPADLRVAERIVPGYKHRTTESDKWYQGAYAPHKFEQTHRDTDRPYATPSYFYPQFVHVPFYTKVVDKPRFSTDPVGYLRRSQRYLDRYVGDRLRYDDFSLPYVYNSYERKIDNRYLRYVRGWPETFVGVPVGLPKYRESSQTHRLYRLNSRVIY